MALLAAEVPGAQAHSDSISASGRFVAFTSSASNLVAGKTGTCFDEVTQEHFNCPEVYVRDLAAGTTERVNVSSSGKPGAPGSGGGAISADGRFVVFEAAGLDAAKEGGVFVRDRGKGTTTRVSVSSSGKPAAGFEEGISADGRFVAFTAGEGSSLVAGDTNESMDVYVRDRRKETTRRVSLSSHGQQANFDSDMPAISADGRFVTFASEASNLVPRDTNAKIEDVFVRDRRKGTTTLVSVSSSGKQGNASSYGDDAPAPISANGRFVAFQSEATNLVAGDTNKTSDVFLRDRATGTTTRVSVSSGGNQANSYSKAPVMSADGRYVAFTSAASNLVADDTNGTDDVFVRDRATGTTTRVSVSSTGEQANLGSAGPAISADGRFVMFYSSGSNLVAGDTNETSDVFVRDRETGTTTLVSVGAGIRTPTS